ncbi:uncharacterized protein EV420DRAFT_1506870 [Desarmillaria tabescens]|uniref:Uncharacterized protein n=1 Tax=Armillaria tabescens TaxID=1929756 RepID=A0AA39NK29_ARMTA|nr:uncharacterized protein EV420DRAFT_1506870 [Desarmillaria tabescens]KAK0467045.1 hypothetical protein EV420DRAFT_1506870 [Desarmillaria tabescens]
MGGLISSYYNFIYDLASPKRVFKLHPIPTVMTRLLFVFLVFFASVFCRASPAPPETNGKRMAQGLPPLPPKTLFRGTRTVTDVQRRTSPSALPFVTYTGRLQVRREDGRSIGTVDSSMSDINSVRSENDLLNPGFPDPLFFGIEGSHLAHDIRSIAKFKNVNQTHPNWVPPSDPQISAQSAIWSIDPTTRKLNVHWINSDGSKPDIMLAWDSRDSQSRGLLIVGDLELTNQLPDIPASFVNLYLVD